MNFEKAIREQHDPVYNGMLESMLRALPTVGLSDSRGKYSQRKFHREDRHTTSKRVISFLCFQTKFCVILAI